ncbi:GDYXXLXY domain-containing protein [Herpetosiphon giganteus]|uniref:GDYXXLXY domain-containing protein n=1 Tax=Herpetosiphon giganteus TaxID=2029754 RepID=UPI001956A65E|nr:GDYXXLXY domain-containing protein [Herpetosiphon giganteus]MBM7842561.1 putative membrane-anchored protein [Herpetosiphon giganteus]
MSIRIGLIILSLLACLGLVNYSVVQREELASTGRVVYLELAPVDPRSLLQGDYMRLNYETFPRSYDQAFSPRGILVITLDEQNIGRFSHFEYGEQPLAANQQRLKYRSNGYDVQIAGESFFFEEGTGERFNAGKYAEFRVNAAGDMALVGLRDKDLQLIK